MIQFFLGDFGRRWMEIKDTAKEYEKAAYGPNGSKQLIPGDFHHLRKIEADFNFICQHLRLDHASKQVYQFSHDLAHRLSTPLTVSTAMENLLLTICKEAGEKLLVHIPSERAIYFNKDGEEGRENLFGDDVFKNFESARPEIRDAGNCLAADLNTAAIFHLMRVVELGLRALAKKLKVKIGKTPVEYSTWETIIAEMERQIAKFKQLSKGKKKSETLEFYHGLIGEFNAFKDVWRNNIMHTRRSYNRHEAMVVFERVRSFMQRLASKVSE
jgi:hypothetical protein